MTKKQMFEVTVSGGATPRKRNFTYFGTWHVKAWDKNDACGSVCLVLDGCQKESRHCHQVDSDLNVDVDKLKIGNSEDFFFVTARPLLFQRKMRTLLEKRKRLKLSQIDLFALRAELSCAEAA